MNKYIKKKMVTDKFAQSVYFITRILPTPR